MKDEKKKKINLGKIAVFIIMTISICISVFMISKSFTNNSKYQKELDEVTNEINTLKEKQDEIFKSEGFSKEFYDTQSKISSLNNKKFDLETKNSKGYKIQNIVFAGFIVFFGSVFSIIIYNILNSKNIVKEQYDNIEKFGKSIGEGYANAICKTEYVPLKCPQCGANLKGEKIEKCPYCNTVLEKVKK